MVVPQTITRQHLERELRRLSSAKKAESSAWFFKTGKGQYGYGDKFLGVTVPQQRVVAKKFRTLSLIDLDVLLKSSYHEHRLTAAIILSLQFHKADAMQQNVLATFFLSHAKCFNMGYCRHGFTHLWWIFARPPAHSAVWSCFVKESLGTQDCDYH